MLKDVSCPWRWKWEKRNAKRHVNHSNGKCTSHVWNEIFFTITTCNIWYVHKISYVDIPFEHSRFDCTIITTYVKGRYFKQHEYPNARDPVDTAWLDQFESQVFLLCACSLSSFTQSEMKPPSQQNISNHWDQKNIRHHTPVINRGGFDLLCKERKLFKTFNTQALTSAGFSHLETWCASVWKSGARSWREIQLFFIVSIFVSNATWPEAHQAASASFSDHMPLLVLCFCGDSSL